MYEAGSCSTTWNKHMPERLASGSTNAQCRGWKFKDKSAMLCIMNSANGMNPAVNTEQQQNTDVVEEPVGALLMIIIGAYHIGEPPSSHQVYREIRGVIVWSCVLCSRNYYTIIPYILYKMSIFRKMLKDFMDATLQNHIMRTILRFVLHFSLSLCLE